MYKLEINFNTIDIKQEEAEEMCMQTDEIFAREDLLCENQEPGRRTYVDKGRKQDYSRFWAALFALKNSSWLVDHLQECFWYNGANKESLMADFIKI